MIRRTDLSGGFRFAVLVLFCLVPAVALQAQVISLEDVSPDTSSYDASDPDSGSGGRVNGIAVDPNNASVMYAATEWGGIYKSIDGGANWEKLDGHRPVVTWDVKVNPGDSNRVYATSFYDGRATSLSGINVSTDGGATWTRPATAVPPVGFCAIAADRTELSAFGISIDPTNSARIYVGTSCGLAVSTDGGDTWSYSTPGGTAAVRIWDVVAAGDGFGADMCGDAGHYYRSTGGSWTAGTGLPSGLCSMAVSPYSIDNTNLFATVGNNIYETTDGFTWTQTRTNPLPQGRIPFVATNKRSTAPAGQVFDLWFGDTSLYRVQCNSGATGAKCGTGNNPPWSPQVLVCSVTTTTTCTVDANCPAGESCKKDGYTRAVGGHDDMGSIVFNPSAANDACPLLMSSDGGVYLNTLSTSPACHTPAWEQPTVTPHALWPFSLDGANLAGVDDDHVYFGNQDNGVFGTFDAGTPLPDWDGDVCCDGFDTVASDFGSGSIIYSVCCSQPRATNFYKKSADFSTGGVINYPATGLPPGFRFPDVLARWGDKKYAMITTDCTVGSGGCTGADGGLYITQDVEAAPIVWTELGNATEPQRDSKEVCSDYPPRNCAVDADCGGAATCRPRVPCAVYTPSNSATFYVQTGDCNGDATTDQLWKFAGTDPAGAWTQITLPNGGGFGIFAVDPNDPNRLIASSLTPTDALMYRSSNGGASWSAMTSLDTIMRGGGDFPIKNQRGLTGFTAMQGYHQPSFVAFDPFDASNIYAGGRDSGIFFSQNDGASWGLVTDPRNSHTSGTPHIPRPRHAYFSEADHNKSVYVSSQGRGVWRLGICNADSWEPDDAVAHFIPSGSPQTLSICGTGDLDTRYFTLTESSAVTIETAGTAGDTTLTLRDAQFNQIDFDDDGGVGAFSRIVRTCGASSVLAAGTYFIQVGEFQSNDTIVEYTLTLNTAPCCGNGAIDPGEFCDDGNRNNGDCCSATCIPDPTGAACDDGNVCTANDTCGASIGENFDGVTAPALPVGWATSGTGSLWTTAAASSDTPPNSAGTDGPATVTDKVLDSPPIAIATAAVLSFRNSYLLENGFDGGVLEFKIGAGAFQDILAAGGSFIVGGYNGTISGCCGNPLAGRQAWTGNTGGFVTTTVSLPPAAVGQTVVLRWRVGTDTSTAAVGQKIDTITLTGGGPFGCRPGTSVGNPAEVSGFVAVSKSNYNFSPVAGATQYDAIRGLAANLPVGPGGGDEVCGVTATPDISDAASPEGGACFWYLVRAKSSCGIGPWGQRSNGAPRITTTCP